MRRSAAHGLRSSGTSDGEFCHIVESVWHDVGLLFGASMTDDPTQCILRNQIEIMGALSLLLRHVAPDLVGKAGELDLQRDDLLQRHKATQHALAFTNGERNDLRCPECGSDRIYRFSTWVICDDCSTTGDHAKFGAKCSCEQPHHLPVWHCPLHGEVVVPMD